MYSCLVILLAAYLGQNEAIPFKGMPGIPPPKPPPPPPLLSFDQPLQQERHTSQQFSAPFSPQQQVVHQQQELPRSDQQQPLLFSNKQTQRFSDSEQLQQPFSFSNNQQQRLAGQQPLQSFATPKQQEIQPFGVVNQQPPLTERQKNSAFAPNEQNTRHIINYSYRLQ